MGKVRQTKKKLSARIPESISRDQLPGAITVFGIGSVLFAIGFTLVIQAIFNSVAGGA